MLLLVAGTLEGFVSPIEWWPIEWKLSVSALTVVAMYAWLRLSFAAPSLRRSAAAVV
jgi:hypothetical protein